LSGATGLEDRQVFKWPTEYRLGRQAQPLVEERGVDASKGDRPLQVTVDELAQAGRRADQAGVEPRPGKEDGAGRPMVGPQRPILGGAPAEFTEGQQDHAVGQLGGREVVLSQ
jgi:hypothetical protein